MLRYNIAQSGRFIISLTLRVISNISALQPYPEKQTGQENPPPKEQEATGLETTLVNSAMEQRDWPNLERQEREKTPLKEASAQLISLSKWPDDESKRLKGKGPRKVREADRPRWHLERPPPPSRTLTHLHICYKNRPHPLQPPRV